MKRGMANFVVMLLVISGLLSCTPEKPDLEHRALTDDVEVIYDEWGIPHIYARSLYDAVFIQGYLCAKDRLFQMDYTRRLVQGRLAELFGKGRLDDDKMSRVVGFARIARKTSEYYKNNEPEVYRVLDAFSSGVNAYIDDAVAGRNGAFLPPEFERIDPSYVPEPWSPEDIFAIGKGMTFQLSASIEEELLAYLTSIFFPELFADLIRYQPLDNTFTIGDFPPPLLTVSGNFVSMNSRTLSQSSFASQDSFPLSGDRKILLSKFNELINKLHKLELLSPSKRYFGSNNWVVSGAHTKSGYPMLANDPHLDLGTPPVWWESHISTPEGDVAGVTFPGAPGVVLGHNDYIAWGATVVAADVTDIYKEEIAPSDPNSVMFKGKRVPMEIYDEPIRVRKEGGGLNDYYVEDFKVRVVPHHGPVLTDILPISAFGTFTMKWTGNDVTTEVTTFMKLNRARNLDDFIDALNYFKTGAQNFVYADVEGNIAYMPMADYPVRPWDLHKQPPTSVLPGTGEYEWDGFIPRSEIFRAVNPTRGFIATANNDPVGVTADNDPFNDRYYIGGFFDYGLREMVITRRLSDYITRGEKIGFEEMAEVQAEVTSGLAEKFLPFLFSAGDERPDLVSSYGIGEALNKLKNWNKVNSRYSIGATLFHVWIIEVLLNTFGDDLTLDSLKEALIGYIEVGPRPLKYFLEGNLPPSGKNYFDNTTTPLVEETKEEILLKSLKDAVDYIKNACANNYISCDENDMNTWRWGLFHLKRFWHSLYDDITGPSYENDGGLSVVDASDFGYMSGANISNPPFYQGGGPSMRHVVELVPGRVRARNALPGGQSGIPGTAHFRDQLPLWLSNGETNVWGSTREVLFLRSDVEAHNFERIVFPKNFPLN